ncbi:polyprenyl diphosphate synthase [Desulfovibrio sp. TomC]|uniref:polyprenyl diphosphate synthase n=1 Tax=Desulfovibrio sp. TomC TaxID=1562888 RepID=UPI000573CCE9|nr:polyprenyl diphosphate synthase [Desulfovibrio sp. TomC]KHK03781.1 Undecaprenyl diphosphate synthase [Desulfovibrio sp. TomC]
MAVIMDGNGRWATMRGLPRSEGHRAGTESARAILTRCRELGIGHLTLYTFSKENWGRPAEEVKFLFDLLVRFLTRELDTLLTQSIRFKVLGEIDELPLATRKVLGHVIAKTAQCTAMTLNLALNYSGREEILRACRRLAAKGTPPDGITEEALAAELYTAGQPDPDLIIRTSGEMRLSGYLLWQSAYSEFAFPDTLWPDFSPAHLDAVLSDYQNRTRRFGLTGEQLQT